jgi:hypothetical protein
MEIMRQVTTGKGFLASGVLVGISTGPSRLQSSQGANSKWSASLVHNLDRISVANQSAFDQLYSCGHALGFPPTQTSLPATRKAPVLYLNLLFLLS